MRRTYQEAPEYQANAYRIEGYKGIAWYVRGWETETRWEEETEDSEEVRTGNLVCTMVGDDRHFSIDPDDVSPLEDAKYCGTCGQIGCGHGVRP